MKKYLSVLLALFVFSSIDAQTEISSNSFGLDQYVEKCTDIPTVRNINGGTVFRITYEPEELWDNTMRGAFEYACKIWEEQLPDNLPINIHAKIGTIRGASTGKKLLSKVSPISYCYDHQEESLSSRIKYVLLAEYNTGHNVTFKDSITSEDFFNKTDITITYNKALLNDFSFSLYSTPVDKYDFVTLVLRDIARGLGFTSGFTANTNTQSFIKTNRILTCFENAIQEAIGTDDVSEAYAKATQGTLRLSVPYYGNVELYAPNNWQNSVSLNYFIPDSTKKITELLTYDFGRGSVIRNIVDDYAHLFSALHGWQTYNIGTGYNSQSVNSDGTTTNLINYNGYVTSFDPSSNANTITRIDSILPQNFTNNISYTSENGFDLQSYLEPFQYMSPDEQWKGKGRGKLLVSLLKKDGTWDLVYKRNTDLYMQPFEVKMSDLEINSDYEQYQRTCDGYLRCRITDYIEDYDLLYNRPYYKIRNNYYVLDYLPQKVKMGFIPTNSLVNTYTANDNEYTQEIPINIKGLEGVERILVEQLDEGNELPVRYEVTDFRKGYFTATVDKELYTQFVVYSYNKNGYTKSDELIIEPLSPIANLYTININNDAINLSLHNRVCLQNETSFTIYSNTQSSLYPVKHGKIASSNYSITISDLEKGSYILKIKSGKRQQSMKFLKTQ